MIWMSGMAEWRLMEDAITLRDRMKMAWFVLTNSRLTNGPKVKEFEKQWSEWLGVDYSLYVSSGSTANSLLVAAVKEGRNFIGIEKNEHTEQFKDTEMDFIDVSTQRVKTAYDELDDAISNTIKKVNLFRPTLVTEDDED